jgi:aspartate/methionine/tyrosine aminotransferase
MPRHPDISAPAAAVPSSIFARLVDRLASFSGQVVPFHLGDTHLLPPEPARLDAMSWQESFACELTAYAPPAGDAALLDALVEKLALKNGIAVEPAQLQVTCGATHAFACAARVVLNAGDEVLALAPYWPLFRGHALAAGARIVEVPFTTSLYAEPSLDVAALLEAHITPRTTALYFISPNNPDGKVLSQRELEAIASVALRHELWVLADEVYEDYAFDGRAHVSIATLPGMAERTLSVFSFSKSYAQAGMRVGYVAGPAPAMHAIRKLANHTVYNVPRAMQRAALVALQTGASFLVDARAEYTLARDLAERTLSVPHYTPEGGSFMFLDLSSWLGPDEDAMPLLEALAADGILLAPGSAFGAAYARWARLCFTAMPRDALSTGLERLSSALARLAQARRTA